ncbi:hypothetical protein [Verrucomicrobium spinosum]|uniref:hypothetical protein n=1 Tax=Verrucomicrobium spinosum TaxID=2736 RepID=UPI0018DC8B86|nr:hypothetical protein [Verrucomicrobium spinosum]
MNVSSYNREYDTRVCEQGWIGSPAWLRWSNACKTCHMFLKMRTKNPSYGDFDPKGTLLFNCKQISKAVWCAERSRASLRVCLDIQPCNVVV